MEVPQAERAAYIRALVNVAIGVDIFVLSSFWIVDQDLPQLMWANHAGAPPLGTPALP